MSLFIYMDSYRDRMLRDRDSQPKTGLMDVVASVTRDDEYSFDNLGMLGHGHCLETGNGRRVDETYVEVRNLLSSNEQIPFVAFLNLSRDPDTIIKEIHDLRRWFPLAVFVLYCSEDEYERCVSEAPADWKMRFSRFFRFPKSEGSDSSKAVRQILDTARATAADKVAKAKFYSAFISYSHSDKAFAHWLHGVLSAAGIKCWLDEKELRAGDRIHSKIENAIKERDKVLLCASESSLKSWWVENELNSVIQREQALWKELGKETLVLIPLDLDGYMFSDAWQSGWKNQVVSRLAPCFKYWSKNYSAAEVQSVIRALIIDTTAEGNRFSELTK